MSTNPVLNLSLSMTDGEGVRSSPDMIRVEFTPEIISEVARALAGLHAMDLTFAEIVISLHDDHELFEDDAPWNYEEKEPGEGDFDVASFWLKVQPDTVSIEIWDEHGGAELHGNESISNIPGLAEALENAKADAYAALRARLA